MELTPPRGTQDLLPDRADAMLGLYEEAHRVARCSATATWRRRPSSRRSCSPARRARPPMS